MTNGADERLFKNEKKTSELIAKVHSFRGKLILTRRAATLDDWASASETPVGPLLIEGADGIRGRNNRKGVTSSEDGNAHTS